MADSVVFDDLDLALARVRACRARRRLRRPWHPASVGCVPAREHRG
jgi:hypothetical protein